MSDILDVKKDRIRVRNVKMRNRAKFRANWSKQDRGIAIFRISGWQRSAILDF